MADAEVSEKTALIGGVRPEGNKQQLAYTSDREKITLSWSEVCYTVVKKDGPPWNRREKTLQILQDVSGIVYPGEILAIIGSSGAGKTTLMDILASRNKEGAVTGSIRVNGKAPDKYFRRISGYVTQDDCLLATQTVRETLDFYAEVRLPRSVSPAQKKNRVENIIDALGLEKVRDSRIGDSAARGISGGEKKRVNVGSELITDPGILFCDEPTTGLDSFNAQSVMQHLRELANQGRTIICTIHQPRSTIFELFDKILLLSRGRTVYFGKSSEAINYFRQLNYPIKPHINPADHMMDVAVAAEKFQLQTHSDAMEKGEMTDLCRQWASSQQSAELAEEIPSAEAKIREEIRHKPPVKRKLFAVSWLKQLSCLCYRTFTNWVRSPMSTYVSLFQTLFMALLVGSIYFQIKNNQGSIQDRVGSLFFVITSQAFSMIRSLNIFLSERRLFQRERASGCYCTSSYFMSKTLVEAPLLLIFPLLFSLVAYYMVGYQKSIDKFGIFVADMVVFVAVAASLYLALGCASPSLEVANILAPITTVLFLLFGGFYVNSNNIPIYYQWIHYISFFKYGYEILVKNEFTGLTFTCKDSEKNGGLCPIPNGETQIKLLGMEDVSIYQNFVIMLAMVLAYRVLAMFCLKFLYSEKR